MFCAHWILIIEWQYDCFRVATGICCVACCFALTRGNGTLKCLACMSTEMSLPGAVHVHFSNTWGVFCFNQITAVEKTPIRENWGVQACNLVFARARPSSFCKGHCYWKYLKICGKLLTGPEGQYLGNADPGLRVIPGLDINIVKAYLIFKCINENKLPRNK